MTLLDPFDRLPLMEALKPPPGFILDAAVGTSYSLDLEALLTVPVAFALFDAIGDQDDADLAAPDPVTLIEAVRRYADRVALFCQAGQIRPTARRRAVFAWLEGSVHEVSAPTPNHVFHPKVWVMSFRRNDDIAVRVLCATRNLTFDRSWDTVVRLDSPVVGDGEPQPELTKPLAEFIRQLPNLAIGDITARSRQSCAELAELVTSASFVLPDGFMTARCHPLGLGDDRPSPLRGRPSRTLVMSPFITAGFLERLLPSSKNCIIVSRPESFDALGAEAFAGLDTRVLAADAAEAESENGRAETTPAAGLEVFDGLHAKLFVLDNGDHARVFTGSANATNAAFGGNVEVLIELEGTSRRVGLRSMLGDDESGDVGLGQLLERYQPGQEPMEATDEQHADDVLDQLRHRIGAAAITGAVGSDDGGAYVVRLTTKVPLLADPPDELSSRCWPSTLGEQASAQGVDPGQPLDVEFTVSLLGLTSFFNFELRLGAASVRYTVNVSLVGEPDDRRDRVLAELLRDRDRFIRYLLLLLSDPTDEGGSPGELARLLQLNETKRAHDPVVPLLEVLVRSLSRRPERLDDVDRLIRQLEATEDGRSILPDGLSEVWATLMEARGGLP